jgi:hypothetical protein
MLSDPIIKFLVHDQSIRLLLAFWEPPVVNKFAVISDVFSLLLATSYFYKKVHAVSRQEDVLAQTNFTRTWTVFAHLRETANLYLGHLLPLESAKKFAPPPPTAKLQTCRCKWDQNLGGQLAGEGRQ